MNVAQPRQASRLAFICYLHHLGVQQARLPEPQSSAAVLLLHKLLRRLFGCEEQRGCWQRC